MVKKVEKQGRAKLGIWDSHVYTTIHKIGDQQGPAVQHRGLYSIIFNNL